MRIYIGSDHGGYGMKEELVKFLQTEKHEAVNLGTFSEEAVDYPDIAREVSEKVRENDGSAGILICGTGIGMCIAANRHPGIRAVDAMNEEMAVMSRRHNDANILCLPGRTMEISEAKKIVKIFLETKFDRGERHVRRISKLES